MKKTILNLTILLFITGSISTLSARANDNKSFNAGINTVDTHNNMVDANQDVRETRTQAFTVYHKFIKDAEMQIKQNKKSFAQFKIMLSKYHQKDKASCKEIENGLEKSNIKLKKTLAIHKTDKRQYKWTTNTMDFNHDMDQLENLMWSMD